MHEYIHGNTRRRTGYSHAAKGAAIQDDDKENVKVNRARTRQFRTYKLRKK